MTKPRNKFSLKRNRRVTASSDQVDHAVLLEEDCPKFATEFANDFAYARYIYLLLRVAEGKPAGREIYERHRNAILPLWIEKHPGTRPRCWWQFDGPPRDRIGAASPPEVQARFLQSRGLLDKVEIKKIPKEWLAPKQPTLSVVRTGDPS